MSCGDVADGELPVLRDAGAGGRPLLHGLRQRPRRRRRGDASPRPSPTSEERRTVTVLFADLSGYTSVAERLDHETVKMLIERCLNRFASEVERFGGRVDKFIGDNVMAVFGAPVAHEDDPERAVRAAFGMHAAMAELNRELKPQFGFDFALRVGVNTGEVLAGRVGESYTVLGDAVNVAARLQAAAPVGGTLVGERTQRLTREGGRLPRARAAGAEGQGGEGGGVGGAAIGAAAAGAGARRAPRRR